MYADDEIALRPREYYGPSRTIHCDHSMIFDIVDLAQACVAGEIALRMGDSAELFYLGHIGYHVDAPFQGRHYALKACRLCEPLPAGLGARSLIITTDPDNFPSARTCERLGCTLESTVKVPPELAQRLEISLLKRRYLWELSPRLVSAP